jgi:hypothetical protein
MLFHSANSGSPAVVFVVVGFVVAKALSEKERGKMLTIGKKAYRKIM